MTAPTIPTALKAIETKKILAVSFNHENRFHRTSQS